jgi:hypothetical protein
MGADTNDRSSVQHRGSGCGEGQLGLTLIGANVEVAAPGRNSLNKNPDAVVKTAAGAKKT